MDVDIGELRKAISGQAATILVAFGEVDAPPLLGAYTIKGLSLAVDLVAPRLVPAHLSAY